MARCESPSFGRAQFDALFASGPAAHGFSLRLDARDAVMMERASLDKPASVLFVRRLVTEGPVDVDKDFVRVWVYDVEETLRTTAETDEQRAFVEDMVTRMVPALEESIRAREERIARVVAASPTPDRTALLEAVSAMLHGTADAEPIVDAVMLAAHDPRAYVRNDAERCLRHGIVEPIPGLHVVALIQHLPKESLLYFDRKESMRDVLPMLADLLRSGPRVAFDPTPFEPRCPAWDRRARSAAPSEIASSLPTVVLVEIKTDSDACSYVCITRENAKRIATWKKKAHLPLTAVKPS